MSRVGKKLIEVPKGVTVDIQGNKILVKGPLGEEGLSLLEGISVELKDNILQVVASETDDAKQTAAYHGLFRSLINNMVVGVSSGFTKELEVVGVGYRATQQSQNVQLQLGFSHPIIFSPPADISIEVVEPTRLRVKGKNKQQVGQVAADIRKLRPPEPYKGKGIRYKDELVRKKAGKTGK
ncbi:MAG TPA: 50S ribosomal protein L6 [Spirochaetota bacterium]|nr:50S ribosomal protein L6 [Spirochaetota bacterium]